MTIAQPFSENKTVAVAMSGGVDSAVAAALLKQNGYTVTGFYMKNWSDELDEQYRKGACPWLEDYEDVKRICSHLEIPYYTFNFEQEYKDKVFQYFLDEYAKGRTPNPDVLCNTEIKFKSFLQQAQKLGFENMATGHYARVGRGLDLSLQLQRGSDPNKDQSYFIHHLTQEQLRHIIFPIGHLPKSEVRTLAKKMKLPVAEKPDSQGLCFIGEINFASFLRHYLPQKPGKMVTVEGKIIGEHQGLQYYTIGQRHGLNIGGTGPYYVVDKRIKDNILVICQGQNHPSLLSQWFTISEPHWINSSVPTECTVKVRYRSKDVACKIEGNRVYLDEPERAVTPGQFAVFYDGDVVLGGAVIETTGPLTP